MILKYLHFSKSKFSYILTGPAQNIFNIKIRNKIIRKLLIAPIL